MFDWLLNILEILNTLADGVERLILWCLVVFTFFKNPKKLPNAINSFFKKLTDSSILLAPIKKTSKSAQLCGKHLKKTY